MSKALKVVGVIAGIAAIVTGNPIFLAVASAANMGAQLTAKKPPARGAVNSIIIQSDPPTPYLIGRTYSGGVLRADVGYGATLKKVPNPYRGMVMSYSGGGPLQALEGLYADFALLSFSGSAATGYFNGFLYRDFRLGALPATALTPNFAGMPGWSSASKLSGKAAVLWNLKFDKDGKVFAGGVPQLGAVWQGVKTYDPRKDSTYPGGSGAHRIANEATWEYSECPGQHALAYAYGRYQAGKKVMGVGLPVDGIEIAHFVELMNVCDANAWKVGGVIFEPADRWVNLKDILAAGGAEPIFSGGKLGLKINAPRVALDTIEEDDLADGEISVGAMQSWRDRLNTMIPKFRSEAHKWEYVPSDAVSVSGYVTEDGEEKKEERQFNLVQQAKQASELCAYELVNGRELGPIEIPCKPRLRHYSPGDMMNLDLPNAGLVNQLAVITRRTLDPGTMGVTLTLVGETAAKHAFALGQTGTAPPTPSLVGSEEIDNVSQGSAYPAIFYDDTPPTDPGEGRGWVRPSDKRLFLFQGQPLQIGGEDVTHGGEQILTSGWVDAQDVSIEEAITLAEQAGDQANAAIDLLDDLGDDGVLTPAEKIQTLIPEDARLEGAYDALVLAAATVGISSSAATTARTTWQTYRNALYPLWNDVEYPTAVTRATYRANLVGYDTALEDLNKAIAERAAQLAEWAGVGGTGKPEDNADVTVLIEGPTSATLARSYDGTVKDGVLPKAFVFRMVRAGVDVTSGSTFGATVVTGTASYSWTGAALEITASSPESKLLVTGTYAGSARSLELVIGEIRDPPPAPGSGGTAGTTDFDSTLENVISTSYSTASTRVLVAKAGATGVVNLTFPGQFYRTSNGTLHAYAKWQWRVVGGVFADVGSEEMSGSEASKTGAPDFENYPGYISLTRQKTGLTSGVDYEFQMLARNASSGNSQWTGTATASGA